MTKNILLFNNEIEMGVRILIILRSTYPKSLDTELINYYSYFCLHSKDLGDSDSIHPDIPNRFGELSVRTALIHKSLKFLVSKGLVKPNYTKSGLEYKATEITAPFLDGLDQGYLMDLVKKAFWVAKFFHGYSSKEIRNYVSTNKDKWGSETSYCTQGLLDE